LHGSGAGQLNAREVDKRGVVLPRRACAQSMPSGSKVENWTSTRNQNLIKIEWDGVPEYLLKKAPDGSPIPPKARVY
jgi:hypothetical protein